MLNLIRRVFLSLRQRAGLGDPNGARLTPGHGWLLPLPADLPLGAPGASKSMPVAPESQLHLRG
jgi:hypothetical protein